MGKMETDMKFQINGKTLHQWNTQVNKKEKLKKTENDTKKNKFLKLK